MQGRRLRVSNLEEKGVLQIDLMVIEPAKNQTHAGKVLYPHERAGCRGDDPDELVYFEDNRCRIIRSN